MGTLNYPRHFVALACMAVLLAAAHRQVASLGVVPSFGFYGMLHASAIAASLRAPWPVRRRLAFIAAAASLCVLSVSLSLYASRAGGTLPGMMKPALLLSLSAGFGAASYVGLLGRCFDVDADLRAAVRIALGCTLATLAVLGFGLYRRGGALAFALAWWGAFSVGLWLRDRGQASPTAIH